MPPTFAHIAQLAQSSYGKLVALLASQSRDLMDAEDAVAEALLKALTRWPEDGVPDNPEAWLYRVARNYHLNQRKSAFNRTSVPLENIATFLHPASEYDLDTLPDKRLSLLFVCAHPAIDKAVRTPLMLQVVLGLDAAQISNAYSIPESTLAQRLVRAKRKIRQAGIPFETPRREQLRSRLGFVLEAVYGAYAIDYRGIATSRTRDSLSREAQFLAELLATLLPEEPETIGLAALICLSLARKPALTNQQQEFVTLAQQSPAAWDQSLIEQGETFLHRAHALGKPGRFQIEAAIQSLHCDRGRTGKTNLDALHKLYCKLVDVAPTLGAQVSLAAVRAERFSPAAGLDYLDSLDPNALLRFQPAWAVRAHLQRMCGHTNLAVVSYRKAISLTTNPADRAFLEANLKALEGPERSL